MKRVLKTAMAALAGLGMLAAGSRFASAQTPPVAAQPVTAQVICHGDSLTRGENASAGLGTATGTTYPGVLAKALGPAWRVVNIGTGGWPLGALIGEAPTKVDPLFDPHLKQNVRIVFGGTNDLGGGHKSAETSCRPSVAHSRGHAAGRRLSARLPRRLRRADGAVRWSYSPQLALSR